MQIPMNTPNQTKPLCLYGGKKGTPLCGQWLPSPDRNLKVLNFSGGKQSSLLAWLAIRGEIERPDVIMSANPGMEGNAVLDYVALIQSEAAKVGIPAYTVKGPNLYEAILNLKKPRCAGCGAPVNESICPACGSKEIKPPATRFDTPAFYTKGPNGTREGKLSQRCTSWAKIAPMNRACRIELEQRFGIKAKGGRIPPGTVEKWIGFSASEVHRIKPPQDRWSCFRYPLVDMGMTNGDVVKWYTKTGTPMPPRSVCRGCFANDAGFFKDMAATDPEGWQQAIAVDEAIRDWRGIGVNNPVYILRSCISLKELEARGFEDGQRANDSCDSGYCFT